MGKFLSNTLYFFKEAGTIFRLNGFSTLLSVVSLFLIFFISLLALGGWHGSRVVISRVRDEADISAYYGRDLDQASFNGIKTSIEGVPGVGGVRMVDADEAKEAMVDVLGKEADILEIFEENPFTPYLEVDVDPENSASIAEGIRNIPGITHVRDNQSLFETISSVSMIVFMIGLIVLVSVAVSTPVITAHVVRSGISAHSDHMRTMRLLGAPGWFVGFPFLITGVVTTLSAAISASALYLLVSSLLSNIINDSVLSGGLETDKVFSLFLVASLTVYALLAGLASGLLAFRGKAVNRS